MSYAIRKDNLGWRAVSGPEDVLEDEFFSKTTPPPPDTRWADYKAQAQTALEYTDLIALRCWKAEVPYPKDWQTYTAELRAIVRATTGDPEQPLPAMPLKPEGI